MEKNKATEKIALRILLMLRSMLEISRKGIGRFLGLDQKRNGTELTYTNQMENGTMSPTPRRPISVEVDILFFEDSVLLKEEI